MSQRHGGDGCAASLSGGELVLPPGPGDALDLGAHFTLYMRLRARDREWQCGVLVLEAPDGAVLSRVYAEDLGKGAGPEIAFEAHRRALRGLAEHL